MKLVSRLGELAEDWQYMLRKNGLRSALPTIGLDIARLPYRHLRFVIIQRALNEPLPDLRPRITLEIRPFKQLDLELVREIDRPSEARLCARRLERGHHGLIAFHQGQPAGYAWGCSSVDPQLERVNIHLEPGDVLCTDVFTTPSFRRQGVQTALSLARFELFQDLGFQRAICYIEEGNIPSLAVWLRKLGGLSIGTIDFLRIGRWYRVRLLHDDIDL